MAEQLKLPEVARRLGVSEKTARRYIKSGTLPSMFIGGTYRVEEEDLEAFLQGARVSPPGKAPRRSSPEPTLFNGVDDERRLRYLRALRALVWNFEKRWEDEPPKDSRATSVLLDTMRALREQGVDLAEAQGDEWTELKSLLAGLEALNDIADRVEKTEEAEKRRAEFTVLQGQKSA